MIKFFRRIRKSLLKENKVNKYLIYAVGEIILVVIGILIALQINNWNLNRIDIREEKELVQNILKDLEADRDRFTNNLKEGNEISSVYMQLYEVGVEGKEDITISKPHYVRRLLIIDATMNKKYSSFADKISNKTIRKELIAYDLELRKLEQGFKEFRNVIEHRMRLFLGEKGIYKLGALFISNVDDAFIDSQELKELAKTIEFQQLLFEAKLKLTGVINNLQMTLKNNSELSTLINKTMDFYD